MLNLLPLVGIALLFWLFIIRPASRRQKELGRMQSSLTVGDEIILTSGVFATVQTIEDDHVGVEIAPGVVIKIARGAVGNVVNKVDEPEQDEAEQDESAPAAGTEEN